jgi:hypothetical protein
MAPEEPNGKRDHVMAGIARAGGSLLKIGSLALLVYVVAMSIFAISKYTTTKSTLLSYGISEATGSLIAWAVMLIAIGIPGLAIVRLFFFRGRPYNYVAAMILPLISWGMAQIPANFDQSGAALKFCSNRPDGTLFCLDHSGIDPLTQKKLVPINQDLADEEFRRKRGLAPKRIVQAVANIDFFDPLTGQPKVWVHQNDDGCIDMFDNPGADPQNGEPLSPITKEVVRRIKECATRRDQESARAANRPALDVARSAEVPLVSSLHILSPVPPNGDSEHIILPVGYTANYGGPPGFTLHCVYRSQTGGVGKDETSPCPSGDMIYLYVHNETGQVLSGITYSFVLPKN